MKKIINSAWRCKGYVIARTKATTFIMLLATITIAFASCKKEIKSEATEENAASLSVESSGNVVNNYTGLSAQTKWELQQARSASARYRNINNAIKDGYTDIGVIVENMGHHYMNGDLATANFDLRKPAILVYNKNHDGSFELVAVEYAVPLSEPRPEGFSGAQDVWDDASGFPFWLLHAWVWTYNPSGVFNPTNPDVHLHD